MSHFVKVGKRTDLKPDAGHTVEVRGRLIALFLYNDQVFAIDDACPHMGASLGDGHVCDGIVSCNWHGWRFRVTDGVWADAPQSGQKTGTYPVRVDGDDILLDIDG